MCQLHEYKMSSKREKHMQHLCSSFHITGISLFLTFPLKSEENIQQQLKPWLVVLQSRRSNALTGNSKDSHRTLSHTSVNTFRCSSTSPFPTTTTLSINCPPERGERRKEGERTLIWLWNIVQFALGQ